jgi:hypothetical protein
VFVWGGEVQEVVVDVRGAEALVRMSSRKDWYEV